MLFGGFCEQGFLFKDFCGSVKQDFGMGILDKISFFMNISGCGGS
jgi:hypothetical protein